MSQFVMINQFRRRCKCVCVCDCCMTKCVRMYTSHGPVAQWIRHQPGIAGWIPAGVISIHTICPNRKLPTCVIYTVTPLLAFTREQVDPSTHFVPELCSFCDRPGCSPRYSNPPPPQEQISKWRLFATVGGELLTTQEHVHMHPRHLLHYFGNI